MRSGIVCVSMLTLALAAGSAQAQSQPDVAFNIGVTSDYVFRGFSQTNEEPAIQGGVDASFGSFYAGAWASNVDFGDDTDAELDIYGGYLFDVAGFDVDVGVIGYHYIGAPNFTDYDLVEFKAEVSRSIDRVSFGASVYYSPDFFGVDEQATYVEGNLGFVVTNRFSVTGAYGKQYLDVGDDYSTWNVGGELALTDSLSLDVRYHDADVDGPLSDGRVTATLGFGF